MKLRLDIVGTQIDSTLGKRAVEELEGDNKRLKTNVPPKQLDNNKPGEPDNHNEDEQNEGEDGSHDDSSSDEESEDEEELLMKELAKLKEEKEDQKKKKKEALVGNPLIAEDGTDKLQKKSWRSGTSFRQKNNMNPDKQYTSNTLNSSTHQNFLSKYIR